MVRTSTFLKTKPEFSAFAQIVALHNNMLKEGRQSSILFLHYSKTMYPVHPKIFQHFLEVAYPGRQYSILDVQQIFPQVDIIPAVASALFINNSLLISIINGAYLKKQSYFEKGTLKALEPPETGHNKIISTLELQQTNQRFPDYFYEFDKETKVWRYYDLKTTTDINSICVTNGNLIGVGLAEGDTERYELIVKYLIMHQVKAYVKYKDLCGFIKDLINNNTLSWTQRNLKLQEYYLQHLSKYPEINPSLVFQHEKFHSLQKTTVPKYLETFINSDVISSRVNTENALAQIIESAGPKAMENYIKEHSSNKNIVAILNIMLGETINNLKNIH